ncbi:MAG: ATP-binding protein [Chloroflexota bacterium]
MAEYTVAPSREEQDESSRTSPRPNGKAWMFARALPVLLLALSVGLSVWTLSAVRETVREDFNQQQLVLARQVAARVTATMQTLRLEVDSLAQATAAVPDPGAALPALLRSTAYRAVPHGLVEVRFVLPAAGKAVALKQGGTVTEEALDETDDYLLRQPALASTGTDQPYIADAPFAPREQPLMILARRAPVAGEADGLVYFLVDDRSLAANAVAGIRSGDTGYAWIINAAGIFLAHPVQEFVGQDAFVARESRQPAISFARIDEIQKERMLAGQEGTSWFTSEVREGPDVGKPIEKLIAFTPIPVGGQGGYENWSVAVVAPAREVEATVTDLWLRIFGALIPAALAVAFVMVLIVRDQRQTAGLLHEVEAATRRRQKSEARYRTLVESADDLIFTLSPEGTILSANRATLRFFGAGNGQQAPENVVGLNIQELVGKATADYLLKEMQEVIRQKRGVSREHVLSLGDHEYWFNTKLRLLEEPSGNGEVILAVSRDMTDKRLMDEQMFNTEKLASLGTLAAGVAHELNNPLTVILGFTDLLLEKASADTQLYQDLKMIEDRSQHCRQIVENLLDYARIGTSMGEWTNANDDLETVLQVASNTFLTHKIKVERHLDPAYTIIRANSKELQQVFLNLINNAVHAMKNQGGTLTVSTAVRGNRMMVKIADTGKGIPEEVQGRIFDPFFTTKGIGEGTGLGLSVSLGLVQKMGGTISVRSSTGNPQTGEPSGSVFTIVLPLPTDSEGE